MAVPRTVTVLLCTVLQLCFGTVYAWSFFQALLVRQLGWTFTETALAFSITIFSLGCSAAWAGAALPRLGPRKLAIIGSLMFAGGYILAGIALSIDSRLLFYLGYGVIGGAGIGLGYVTPVATAAKWYPDRKGLATGIVVMGFGVGAFLLSIVLAPILIVRTEGDLPLVFGGLGLLFAAILLPASFFLSNPPPGYRVVSDSGGASGGQQDEAEPGTVRQCIGSREFTIMWLVFFFNIAAGISVISFQSSLLQDVWGLADPSIEPENACGIRSDTDRRQFSLQRGRAAALGHAFGPDRPGSNFPDSAREPDDRVRHPDDGEQPVGLFGLGVLRAPLFRRWLCHHAFLRA